MVGQPYSLFLRGLLLLARLQMPPSIEARLCFASFFAAGAAV
jgi:hypothetical protein